MTPGQAKTEWRRKIRARLNQLSDTDRAAGASLICQRLKEQGFWQAAAAVLFYAPLPDEVNLWPLLEESLAHGKIIALPRFDSGSNKYVMAQFKEAEKDLNSGAFGVREPSAASETILPEKIDVALIPGVGFDLVGNRLGRGKGYYDRLLADFRGFKCGIGLDEQIAEEFAAEYHDIRMNCILTPTRVIECQ